MMIRTFLLLICIAIASVSRAQQIVTLVLVGDNGITEDIKKAKFFIAVKNYGDTMYERLEYRLSGPLMKTISYKDSLLTIKNGRYNEYSPDGWISGSGTYIDNKKSGSWYTFEKKGKAVFEDKWEDGKYKVRVDLDSVAKAGKGKKADSSEIEAKFKAGEKAYMKIITDRMNESINAGKLNQGGSVRIRFVVSKSGKMEDFFLTKSSGFAFDEESLSIMRSITGEWIPASQNGRLVKAYREQPITFNIKEE